MCVETDLSLKTLKFQYILRVFQVLFKKKAPSFSQWQRLSLNCLVYACSAANPILYTVFSQKFRDRFESLLCLKRQPGVILSANTFGAKQMGAKSRPTATNNDCARDELQATTTVRRDESDDSAARRFLFIAQCDDIDSPS